MCIQRREKLPLAVLLVQGDDAPEPPKENVMINSLIHEYLAFNGMVGTSRMLALGTLLQNACTAQAGTACVVKHRVRPRQRTTPSEGIHGV